MTSRERVVVAMSGGVDSSVAAALLQQQGYDVIGMMLRLWSEPGREGTNRCCTPDAMNQARRVAAMLGIPFYAVDGRDFFRATVVDYFIDGYTQGETPNPCLVCNRQVRWEYLLDQALALGAVKMATGHYARLHTAPDGHVSLMRAVDLNKDQSYILHVLTQEKLRQAIFPLGGYTKPEVRQLAHHFNLPVAERKESQDLCFLGDEDYRAFLKRNAPARLTPGEITTSDGALVGHHEGLAFYTIGQRKGLNLASSVPMYVVAKDIAANRLVVDTARRSGSREFAIANANWSAGEPPAGAFHAMVKIRYKSSELPADIIPTGGNTATVILDEPTPDITPGQAAVFYNHDICLGGGIIQSGSTHPHISTGDRP